jgi:hypothetical protein
MIYLVVVGLDRRTLGPWHGSIGARDVTMAKRLARVRAPLGGGRPRRDRVIGPYSSLLGNPAEE